MAITIRPLGGLGNQLFVYATGATLAQKLGTDLVVDLIGMSTSKGRSYELGSFHSRVTKIVDSTHGAADANRFALVKKLLRAIGQSTGAAPLVKERGFWFDPRVMQAPDGSTLDGYLQSWKYFAADAAVLKTEIRNIRNPSSWFMETKEELFSSPPWVGIHVRRCDYLAITQMGIATDYYYQRSIDLISQLSGVDTIRVFSDDVDLASSLPSLSKAKQVSFLRPPEDSVALESLILMSMASHLVMANSSFSWWAAWLSNSEERVVTYPRPWVDFRLVNDRDLPLPNWIGLGRENMSDALSINVGY